MANVETASDKLNTYHLEAPVDSRDTEATKIFDNLIENANLATHDEHNTTFLQAIKRYPKACAWSAVVTMTIIMVCPQTWSNELLPICIRHLLSLFVTKPAKHCIGWLRYRIDGLPVRLSCFHEEIWTPDWRYREICSDWTVANGTWDGRAGRQCRWNHVERHAYRSLWPQTCSSDRSRSALWPVSTPPA